MIFDFLLANISKSHTVSLWHSADEKVTKCHVRGEVVDTPVAKQLLTIKYGHVVLCREKESCGLFFERGGHAQGRETFLTTEYGHVVEW